MKKKPSWHEQERHSKLKGRQNATGEIEILEYRFIEQGFYEVLASTWDDKISFEGNMCGGLLKQFMKKVIAEGGKVKRVTHNLVDRKVKKELKQAESELKEMRSRAKRASKLLDW